jgi:hypothetical protein
MYITKEIEMSVTAKQFNTLEDLFDYYNEALFENELPDCLVNLSRHKGAHGFFAPERWKDKGTDTIIHEISLNPDTINRPDKQWHSTLVHEMVHLWQEALGHPSRQCYHNKEWAAKMETVGLMPSHNGQAGGKKTGQSMTHYVMEGGAFETAFSKIDENELAALKLPYLPTLPSLTVTPPTGTGSEPEGDDEDEKEPKRSGIKVKYTCFCENNVWGKPDLRMICMECEQEFKPQQPKAKKHQEYVINQIDLAPRPAHLPTVKPIIN